MANFSFGATYQRRVWLLIGGTAVFFVIAWYLSFSKTYYAYLEQVRMKRELQAAAQVDQDVIILEKKLASFKQDSTQLAFSQARLFELVTDWCEEHAVTVRALPEAVLIEEDGYRVYMNRIEFQGNYAAILQLMYALEQEYRMGQIMHSQFELQKNRTTRQIELVAKLHLHNIQSITKNEN